MRGLRRCVEWGLAGALPALLIGTLLLPLIYLYLTNTPFFVTNGWDEPSYFSALGSCGFKTPGYYPISQLICALNMQGISGSKIGFYADVISLSLMPALLAFSVNRIVGARKYSLFLACCILLAPVLFNYANPWIEGLYSGATPYGDHILHAGRESYQTLLRGPQPQFSIMAIVLALALYARWPRIWLLFLPLPALYFYTAIPYAILVCAALAFSFVKVRGLRADAIVLGLASATALLVWALISALALKSGMAESAAQHFRMSRAPALPVYILPALCGIVIGYQAPARQNAEFNIDQSQLRRFQIVLFGCLMIIANMHLGSGLTISFKNVFDYGASFVGGVSLALLLLQIRAAGFAFFLPAALATGLAIALLNLTSTGWNHPWFIDQHEGKFSVFRGLYPQDKELLERAMNTPERAIFENSESLGSLIPFAAAGKAAPPLSYQYLFDFYTAHCPAMERRNARALEWLAQNAPMPETALQYADHIDVDTAADLPDTCQIPLARGTFFTVGGPYLDNGWVHFSWNDIVKKLSGGWFPVAFAGDNGL